MYSGLESDECGGVILFEQNYSPPGIFCIQVFDKMLKAHLCGIWGKAYPQESQGTYRDTSIFDIK